MRSALGSCSSIRHARWLNNPFGQSAAEQIAMLDICTASVPSLHAMTGGHASDRRMLLRTLQRRKANHHVQIPLACLLHPHRCAAAGGRYRPIYPAAGMAGSAPHCHYVNGCTSAGDCWAGAWAESGQSYPVSSCGTPVIINIGR